MATLKKYQQKRDFKETPEPRGTSATSEKRALHFVIQRHAASRLHYDFRLEMDGVLKSWAVPKGPSLNPTDKRLAMMVEDHPYDYQYFEGTIPEGNYGAGEVEIWDKGTYEALEKQPRKKEETVLLQALKNGSLKFILHGQKLKGEFALVRMKNNQEDNAWLLLKHRDAYAVDTPYDAEAHVKKKSKVTTAVLEKKAKKNKTIASATSGKRPAAATNPKKYSRFIKPMLATLSSRPFNDKDWIFEIKWDGYRAIAETGKEFRFYSRNGLNFSGRYPVLAEALQQQEQDMIIDGEIVAYNDAGLPDFQTLQYYGEHPDVPIIYHVFDLLYLNGHRTEELPLLQRKELLKQALVENDWVRYCDHIMAEGVPFFKMIQKKNLEGMIAKRSDSHYAEGKRSAAWLKIKHHHTEEVVIAGYTAPRGSRKKFGALILGRYQDGKLVYAGHTGTGFNAHSLKALYEAMQPLVVQQSPFEQPPKTNMPAVWVRPKLVCTIKFSELTKEHIFRQPVFQGLREDKAATEVVIPENENTMTDKTTVKKKPASSRAVASGEKETIIKANGKAVKLSNPQKVYWPEEGYTKSDLVDYYNRIAPFILPYLKDRPESLNRFPDGILGESFYQKDAGAAVPGWITTVPIYSESNHKEINYVVCNDRASMLYLANLGCIELNPWNSTTKKPNAPTYMIMDIDPSEKNTFEQVIEATLAVKQVLDDCGAISFCKTSGSTGLHVYIPMGNQYEYEQVKDFAHLIAMQVTGLLPETTTLERNLKKRGNKKIYIDYLQNRRGQTVACAYSVRPRPGATVSTPLRWEEVRPGLDPRRFTIKNIHRRLEQNGDLFRPVLGKGINMLQCIKKLSG
ncbi:DNA ligase D [Niabella sp. CC-SYL272]|uniref:DNA ligase D n=1 Tax=Niabella agricola TaxID=2891571 RepID=UPI001F34DDBC|nr:DNA ligase D [Niabella agricola]MCF3108346.1 DNA ligase D [Niabella agricola]